MFHQHSMSIDFRLYRDRRFVFGFSSEKALHSSYTGMNTRAGQQMLVKIIPANGAISNATMPDNIYLALLREQILEMKDLGLKVYDSIKDLILNRYAVYG